MKRIVQIFILVAIVLATTRICFGNELVNKVKSKIAANPSYSIALSIDGYKSLLTVKGDKFKLISDEAKIYYNGEVLWNYDVRKNEVNVENLDPQDPNILMNPSKLLYVPESEFTVRTLSGSSFELTPTESDAYYSKIVVELNSAGDFPKRIVIYEREVNNQIDISVGSFTPLSGLLDKEFEFNPKEYKNIDIVDFR